MGLSKSAALGLSLLAATSIGACNKTSEPTLREGAQATKDNLTVLKGTVSDERLNPGNYGVHPRYSFAIDTEGGRKAIEVLELDPVSREFIATHESVEVLLQAGATVEIQVPIDQVHKQVIRVTADQIRLK